MLLTSVRRFSSFSQQCYLRAVPNRASAPMIDPITKKVIKIKHVFEPEVDELDSYFAAYSADDEIPAFNPDDNGKPSGPSIFVNGLPLSDRTASAWFSTDVKPPLGIHPEYDPTETYKGHHVLTNTTPMIKHDCITKIVEYGALQNWNFEYAVSRIPKSWCEAGSLTALIDKILTKPDSVTEPKPIIVSDTVNYDAISVQYRSEINKAKLIGILEAALTDDDSFIDCFLHSNESLLRACLEENVQVTQMDSAMSRKRFSLCVDSFINIGKKHYGTQQAQPIKSLMLIILRLALDMPSQIYSLKLPQHPLSWSLLEDTTGNGFYTFPKPLPPFNSPMFAFYGLCLRLYEDRFTPWGKTLTHSDICAAYEAEHIYQTLCTIWEKQKHKVHEPNDMAFKNFVGLMTQSEFAQKCIDDIKLVKNAMNREKQPNIDRYNSVISGIEFCLTIQSLLELMIMTHGEPYFESVDSGLKLLTENELSHLRSSYVNYSTHICDELDTVDDGDEDDPAIEDRQVIDISFSYASKIRYYYAKSATII